MERKINIEGRKTRVPQMRRCIYINCETNLEHTNV
jgi:hypothetical protein